MKEIFLLALYSFLLKKKIPQVDYGVAEEKPSASNGGKVGVTARSTGEALTKEQFMHQVIQMTKILQQ